MRGTAFCRSLGSVVGLFVLLLGTAPNPVCAQQWDLSAGVAIPVGKLSTMVERGPALGLGMDTSLHPRVDLRVRLSGTRLFATKRDGNILDVLTGHYMAGPAVLAREPTASGWPVILDLLIGGTSFGRTGTTQLVPQRVDQLETSLTLSTGIQTTSELSERWSLVAQARWIYMLTKGEGIEGEFGAFPREGFGALSLVPLSIGLRWRR